MLAGSGTLNVFADGTFEYVDYYPRDPVVGHLAWITDQELDVLEELGLLSIYVFDETTLTARVTQGAFTHTDEGRLTCTEWSPPPPTPAETLPPTWTPTPTP
jgi:hypothetical protein